MRSIEEAVPAEAPSASLYKISLPPGRDVRGEGPVGDARGLRRSQSSPAQSRARRAPRPPYSVQGRAFFRTPYRGRRTRSASPENHWTNEIFCRQRQKINVLWSGARSPNAKTLNARTAASRRFIDKLSPWRGSSRSSEGPPSRRRERAPIGRSAGLCCARASRPNSRRGFRRNSLFSPRKDFRPNGCSMRSALSPPSVRSTSS